MSVLWSSQFSAGGGGAFITKKVIPKVFVGGGIAVTTISPPAGQAVRLVMLRATITTCTGVEISVGGSVVLPSGEIMRSNTDMDNSAAFVIGVGNTVSTAADLQGVGFIQGGIDEDLVFNKTVSDGGFFYTHETGVFG